MRPSLTALYLSVLLASAVSSARADELVETNVEVSPDRRFILEVKLWDLAAGAGEVWFKVTLRRGARIVAESKIGPEGEPRYAKLSWAPDSTAALVAINYKAGEDWLLLRPHHGQVSVTRFTDDKVQEKILALPFREEIKSHAPVGRVPWSTVHWLNHRRCSMTYIFDGIGYEGTARLLIDYAHHTPTLRILGVDPKVNRALFEED